MASPTFPPAFKAAYRPARAPTVRRPGAGGAVPFLRGVNTGAAELSAGAQWTRSEATDYYMTQKGMNVFRVTLLWENMQPTLLGALDATQVTNIQAQIDRNSAAGGYTIIEPHNFGRRTISGTEYIIGETGTVTSAHFADYWSKVAAQWGSNPRVIFNIINEPHDQVQATLTSVLNAAIVAIRATGTKNLILVPGNGFTNRAGWKSGATPNNYTLAAGIVDSGNNWAIDYHIYFDPFSPGNSDIIEANLMNDVTYFTSQVRTLGLRAFVGEFAVAQDPASLAIAKTFLDHVEANKDVWIGWAWWGGGGWWTYSYDYLLDPYGSKYDNSNPWRDIAAGGTGEASTWVHPIDKPQWAVLENFLGGQQGSNLLPASRDFEDSSWQVSNASVTSRADYGIIGLKAMTALVEDGANAQHFLHCLTPLTIPSGSSVTVSFIARKGTRNMVQLLLWQRAPSDFGGYGAAVFDLNAGTYSFDFPNGSGISVTGHTMLALGNGAYLCTATFGTTGVTQVSPRFIARDATLGDTYTGTSGNAAFYIEHAQVEVGTALSRIKHTYPAARTAPTAFSFTAVTGATASTVYTSNAIVVRGLNSPAPISITNGTYTINGGAYTSSAGYVRPGDSVTVRLTTGASGATVAALTIGGVSANYSVTVAAVASATFDPATKASTVTLSNGNLTAASSGTSPRPQVIGTTSASTGKKYFSVVTTGTAQASQGFGFAGSGFVVGTDNESGPKAITLAGDGNIYGNSSLLSSVGSSVATSSVIDCAIDIDAKLAWFRKNNGLWNNSGTANPATGVGGISVSFLTTPITPLSFPWATTVHTVNFGGSAYTNAAPSGYGNW